MKKKWLILFNLGLFLSLSAILFSHPFKNIWEVWPNFLMGKTFSSSLVFFEFLFFVNFIFFLYWISGGERKNEKKNPQILEESLLPNSFSIGLSKDLTDSEWESYKIFESQNKGPSLFQDPNWKTKIPNNQKKVHENLLLGLDPEEPTFLVMDLKEIEELEKNRCPKMDWKKKSLICFRNKRIF